MVIARRASQVALAAVKLEEACKCKEENSIHITYHSFPCFGAACLVLSCLPWVCKIAKSKSSGSAFLCHHGAPEKFKFISRKASPQRYKPQPRGLQHQCCCWCLAVVGPLHQNGFQTAPRAHEEEKQSPCFQIKVCLFRRKSTTTFPPKPHNDAPKRIIITSSSPAFPPSSPMGIPSKHSPRPPTHLFPYVLALSFFSLTALLLYKVDDVVSRTKTVVGHNLEPTPWHVFPHKALGEETRQGRAYKIIHCSYLTCRNGGDTVPQRRRFAVKNRVSCPDFFGAIRRDLQPWAATRISRAHLAEAQKLAAFRVVIVGGKLFVDWYYACVQSRAMFTIWGLLQLLRRYPGLVPDVDMMFDCMDKPTVNRTEHQSMPLPLFRYCTTKEHFDIPFPDWSFWGWPEINIRPWEEEFPDIKQGSQAVSWKKKFPLAYWKGNPDVSSPIRTELLNCNHSRKWGAEILRQDWGEAARSGFHQSKLSNQCNHRYKIYAEGFAWSVSLKYILSCGSVALIISPQYEDFFSRGLIPKQNFWLVDRLDLCPSIKHAVDWGNQHPHEAEAIGKRGQDFMESLSMDRIYDYMFHLISEYSKLQDFKPTPSSTALEVCVESVLCFADEKQRIFLNKSTAFPSQAPPCTLKPA